MRYRKFGLLLGLTVIAIAVVGTASAASSKSSAVPTIADSQLSANDTTIGGSQVLPTTRTIPHWWGSTFNPDDGVTYGYSMVGSDPNNCSGPGCSTTIPVDITPVNVVITAYGQTWTFNGTDVVGATLASPEFALNDYGSTSASSTAGATASSGGVGPGGVLSQGDAGNQLQLEDATMRAQFNQTGSSPYHVILQPHVLPAVTFNVPQNQGTVLASARGVVFGDVSISWWSSHIQNLETQADPTHLPLYLTNSVMLYEGGNPQNCCVIGYHGTYAAGYRLGQGKSNGNEALQTFAWASYVEPGIFNPHLDWALQDIHALSHEISEWADDPFVDNSVEPWLTPTAPQYGCTGILETGDPVVGIGFSKGTNSFDQNQWADGTYHPEDEVFLPWYMRTSPNTISEPTQSPSVNGGRYTLMGDLNPYPGFRAPATGC